MDHHELPIQSIQIDCKNEWIEQNKNCLECLLFYAEIVSDRVQLVFSEAFFPTTN